MITLTMLSLLIFAQASDLIGETIIVTAQTTEKAETTMAATNYLFYGELWTLRTASDMVGLEEMVKTGQAISVKKDTTALLLKVHNNQFLADHRVLEVRILDGEHKNKKVYFHIKDFSEPVSEPEQKVRPTKQEMASEYRERFDKARKFAKGIGRQGRAKYLKDQHIKIVEDMCRRYDITEKLLEEYVTAK